MADFVRINDNGQFSLDGKRWYCNSVIYFGHQPGAMNDWFTPEVWPRNEAVLERDFARMAELGINHSALFLSNKMFFERGKLIARGFECLDRVVETAKANDVRLTLFCGPFIDNPEEYLRITGEEWHDDNRWLPSFNPALFEAYVQQIKPLVERYKNEPTVLGYGDRIDRFYKGFDNLGIPFNLKEEWAAWLQARYGSMRNLLEIVGGTLEGNPRDFHEVLLPQESKFNASLYYPLAYDYILMQKKEIGEAQARWDAAVQTHGAAADHVDAVRRLHAGLGDARRLHPGDEKAAGHLDGILPLAGDAPIAGESVRGMGAHARIRHPSQSRRHRRPSTTWPTSSRAM